MKNIIVPVNALLTTKLVWLVCRKFFPSFVSYTREAPPSDTLSNLEANTSLKVLDLRGFKHPEVLHTQVLSALKTNTTLQTAHFYWGTEPTKDREDLNMYPIGDCITTTDHTTTDRVVITT
jgi:hypothetical protein